MVGGWCGVVMVMRLSRVGGACAGGSGSTALLMKQTGATTITTTDTTTEAVTIAAPSGMTKAALKVTVGVRACVCVQRVWLLMCKLWLCRAARWALRSMCWNCGRVSVLVLFLRWIAFSMRGVWACACVCRRRWEHVVCGDADGRDDADAGEHFNGQ